MNVHIANIYKVPFQARKLFLSFDKCTLDSKLVLVLEEIKLLLNLHCVHVYVWAGISHSISPHSSPYVSHDTSWENSFKHQEIFGHVVLCLMNCMFDQIENVDLYWGLKGRGSVTCCTFFPPGIFCLRVLLLIKRVEF